jgi:hypothetical protein
LRSSVIDNHEYQPNRLTEMVSKLDRCTSVCGTHQQLGLKPSVPAHDRPLAEPTTKNALARQ